MVATGDICVLAGGVDPHRVLPLAAPHGRCHEAHAGPTAPLARRGHPRRRCHKGPLCLLLALHRSHVAPSPGTGSGSPFSDLHDLLLAAHAQVPLQVHPILRVCAPPSPLCPLHKSSPPPPSLPGMLLAFSRGFSLHTHACAARILLSFISECSPFLVLCSLGPLF